MKHIYLSNGKYAEVIPSNVGIDELMSQRLNTRNQEENEDAFYIADLGDVVLKHKRWNLLLPRVEPHYAVKCNDDPMIVQTLANLGTGFDCASKAEIKKVMDLGVTPDRIIYANPCKQSSHIKYASTSGVNLMTFDNEDELHKIKEVFPNARLVLRILPGDFKAQCNLGYKYGCHPKRASSLLKVAMELDLNIVGVSFHVGSGCMEAEAFPAAIALARTVFDSALQYGFNPYLLDIGGGYPGFAGGPVTFEEMCKGINSALEQFFPEDTGVRVIAEPGRYFAASAIKLACNVIAKRVVARGGSTNDNIDQDDAVCNTVDPAENNEPAYMYYMNDGVYGSFNCLLYDHAEVVPTLLEDRSDEPQFPCSIWGPTCDGLDCINSHTTLPELFIGEWIVFDNMGAYTMSAASEFNGMPKPKGIYVLSEDLGALVACKEEELSYQPVGMVTEGFNNRFVGRDVTSLKKKNKFHQQGKTEPSLSRLQDVFVPFVNNELLFTKFK